jgi:hypothetical protein
MLVKITSSSISISYQKYALIDKQYRSNSTLLFVQNLYVHKNNGNYLIDHFNLNLEPI